MKLRYRETVLTALVSAALLLGAVPGLAAETQSVPARPPALSDLDSALRDLWVGHIFWVRNYVLMSRLGDKAAASTADAQVVRDARAIADAISPYYGKAASDQLFALLAGHYGAIKEYASAAFAGNASAKKTAVDRLTANADAIALFLSTANPNWPKATLDAALRAHGAHHVMEIDAIASGDYTMEADVWAKMLTHIYTISDVLAQGIEKQFGD